MKTISIFQIQEINDILKEKNYDYILKIHDTCGSQSLYLQCIGAKCDIYELCNIINDYLKPHYLEVKPGAINPYYLVIK